MTEEDWEELSKEVEKVYPQFKEKLYDLCEMSDNDFRVCLLLKINMPVSDIAKLMCTSSSGIGSVRTKLYARAYGVKKGVSEWDTIIRSL